MAYIQTVIWTMLFVVFVEMLFPASDMKKCLRLVLGFIVMYTLCGPIVEVLVAIKKEEPSFESRIHMTQLEIQNNTAEAAYLKQKEQQEYNMKIVFEEQLEKQVKTTLEQTLDLVIEAMDVVLVGKRGVYEVEKVVLEVSLPKKEGKIQLGIGSKAEAFEYNEAYLKKEIKTCLNNFYNWDNDNIYITVQAK